MRTSPWRLRTALIILVALLALRLWSLMDGSAKLWTASPLSVRAQRQAQVSLMARGPAVAQRLSSGLLLLGEHQHQFLHALAGQRPAETLSGLVISAAERSGFVIESVTPGDLQQLNGGPVGETASVLVGGVGSLAELTWWIAAMESGAPRLGVASVQLSRQGAQSEDVLRVQATVVALVATISDTVGSVRSTP